MAMFNRELTKDFYTEIANDSHVCYFCEKNIRDKRQSSSSAKAVITIDEMHRAIKALDGQLTGKRILSFNFYGNTVCICPECLSKTNQKVNPHEYSVVPVPAVEEITEEIKIDKTDKKEKKKNANK